MREGGGNNLPAYELEPPEWLPKAHVSADIGYHGFYPPRPGQAEDNLSEAHVKNGFSVGHVVAAETFSAQENVKERFHANALVDLENLMNDVFLRRSERVPAIPPSSFRMPSRVTLNDARRQAWFADLANPDVPLQKLGRNVPHGAKGHDLLDLLQNYNVAIPRAVWLLRVFGANETAGLRNKPSYNPTVYSVEWANVMTSYIRKLLSEIGLPSAPRPGLNVKQTFKGVFADPDSRERWISRFTYCLKLLRPFYSEELVDHRTFLTWLVQQMASCNLAQAGFVARLADEYLDGIVASRALTRPFVEACLNKFLEIRSSSAPETLVHLEALLNTLIQRVCLSLPDALINPKSWHIHRNILSEIMSAPLAPLGPVPRDRSIHNRSRDIEQMLLNNFEDIKHRNEAMLFHNLPPRAHAQSGFAVSDIQFLNTITSTADLDTVTFFDTSLDNNQFPRKLDILLTWAVTPMQYGDHRPYVAATLLRNWKTRIEERASRRDIVYPYEFLQDQLFDWLDTSEAAAMEPNLSRVSNLFGKLMKYDLFSYTAYIQRLIARGEDGLSVNEERVSCHRSFLRCFPLYHPTPALVNQRRVTLYGVRAREIPEDLIEKEMRKEIRAVMPELFGGGPAANPSSSSGLLVPCSTVTSGFRYEQVRVLQQWLLPRFRKYVSSQSSEAPGQLTTIRLYCIAAEILTHVKCYGSLLELCLATLRECSVVDQLSLVTGVLRRYTDIWSAMNVTKDIVSALLSVHNSLRTRGSQSRPLLHLLIELDNGRHMDSTARDHVFADVASFTHALCPHSDQPAPVPPVLPEILLLAEDPHLDAASSLANSLWYKYRTSSGWAWNVWDNAVASLRQIPSMTFEVAERHAYALKYGLFLLHVDQHLPDGLDEHVLSWLLGPGKNEVAALSTDSWNVLTVVLLYLCVQGALTVTTILKGLIYPAWQSFAGATSAQDGTAAEILHRAVNNLFDWLMLRNAGHPDGVPPADFMDIQRMQVRRCDAYRDPHFSLLLDMVPVLVFIEHNQSVSSDLREASCLIRQAISTNNDFRRSTCRNLDALRTAFDNSLENVLPLVDVSEPLIDALRLVLSGPDEAPALGLSDWKNISCLLSPWKLATTAIQLQFALRQMGRAMSEESTRSSASDHLDDLIISIFRHNMSSEEAYFVAEMVRGSDAHVVAKFINNGLRRVAETLNGIPQTPDMSSLLHFLDRAGELLRVLVHVTEPLRDEHPLPKVDSYVQELLLNSLCSKMVVIESLSSSTGDGSCTNEQFQTLGETIILFARLLQFHLAFPVAPSSAAKNTAAELCGSLFRLALIYGSGDRINLLVHSLLLDTLFYLLDEVPSDSKSVITDPFRNYPNASASDIPLDMPAEYRSRICTLLHQLPPNATVANLSNAYRDSSGNIVHISPVLNRPWEWIENLGDPLQDPKEEAKEREEKERLKTRYLVKNAGSLSLELFGARMTGEGYIPQHEDARVEGTLHTFWDGLTADSIFKRDWRESRIQIAHSCPPLRKTEEEETGVLTVTSQVTAGGEGCRKRSPTASAQSSTSAHVIGPMSFSRQSPGHSTLSRPTQSTTSEVIDVDSMSTSADSTSKHPAAKRKASKGSDSDIEILEGPSTATARAQKKPRAGKAPAKTRTRKK